MSWKRRIRPAADKVAGYSGVLWACEQLMRSGTTVLMYHRVLEDGDDRDYPFPSIVLPRTVFEAQLDYLADHARVLTVYAALNELRGEARSPKPVVCLTFDDGYIDNFEIAAPLLEERGLLGTFFITAGAVEARAPLWYDRAAELWTSVGAPRIGELAHGLHPSVTLALANRGAWIESLKRVPNDVRVELMGLIETELDGPPPPCPLMTPAQIRELADRGHEIGSHTCSHPILTRMTPEGRRQEIGGAKALLEAWTGREVPGFCYPNGDYDAAVARQLEEAGHEYACTTSAGRNDRSTNPFELRRVDVTPDRVTRADGRFDPLAFRAEVSMLHPTLRRIPRFIG